MNQTPRRRRSDHPLVRFGPIAAYLILALAVAYAVWETNQIQDHNLEQHEAQTKERQRAVQDAVFIGCQQRNETKEAVVNILKDFRSVNTRPERSGLYAEAIAKLKPDDCIALAKTVGNP